MSVKLRPADLRDVPRLKTLWQRCFGDEAAYVDLCFQQGNGAARTLVLETEGGVQSMLLTFAQEMQLPEGTRVPMWYVYAFCTHPEGQSRGYGRRLLAWTAERAAAAGAKAVVMVPGEPSLFRFYETLGYETACFTWEQVISQEKRDSAGLVAERCTPQTYQILREQLLTGISHVSYPEDSLAWQEMLCHASGGGLYRIGTGVAAVECWGGSPIIKELLARDVPAAAQALLQALGAESTQMRTCPPMEGQGKPFGVVRWLDENVRTRWNRGWGRYLALAFD